MQGISSVITGAPILPILQPKSPEQAVAIAGAVRAGGLTNLEVVRRTDAAGAAITAIREAYPDMIVGMGTVLNEAQVQEAIDVGSQFIVTPTVSPRLLDALMAADIPFIPGTASPSDILMASEYGLTELKFFPAHLNGGAGFLKAVSSIFQNIQFCPTGGVSAQNINQYLPLANVFAVGGSWMIPQDKVEAEDWQSITQSCAEAITLYNENVQ
ncbi:bifunctional 4-hydroxy-2-oxoglutarate aldolase/2-dehydro-3-deoxy-phosphogluconate aldolase [Alteromonas sp. a30]|uniref:bifunctional 4-hydroxy-2-oxoglutarate aldolase/2-dehydro-3-deoxy-phosphogluconate aldolase n=1 Tax=Alteromonas sp. a30 TaxID=2730917 RepID=UPI00227F528F|nr:bifunctional 4-hydroxy-2-oxoglutarate aldolase/2-dehydro-3-deoxy-phosphogluconate aldolase [Alteromonas sp. a30]MCY7297199.1 bifunctional 4-hydroxy-2-oxoglutarate aldolase/2-dehydro-3-deoxy-phosphogluconate aldolase [Alteromonas sp. a30]